MSWSPRSRRRWASSSCRRTSTRSRTCRRRWKRWTSPSSAPSRSCCPCSQRSIRAGAPRASIPRRRYAMSEAVLACSGLKKTYQGPAPVEVLRGVDFSVRARERVAIMGKSGSGKSTLLHLLGGLDVPSAGTVRVQGRPFGDMGEAERGRVRNETLGFVYQFHHLLPEFTALENVAMPLFIPRMERRAAVERARAALAEDGVAGRIELH